jgi:hypothetical protein
MNIIDSYNIDGMTLQYTAMSAGHPESNHTDLVGNSFADQWGPGIGGTVRCSVTDLYAGTGGQVRIVMAEGARGSPEAEPGYRH